MWRRCSHHGSKRRLVTVGARLGRGSGTRSPCGRMPCSSAGAECSWAGGSDEADVAGRVLVSEAASSNP